MKHHHQHQNTNLGRQSNLSRHHRLPRSTKGTDDPSNISLLTTTHHAAWHTLFLNWSAHKIAETINELFLDPAYEFICVPTAIADEVKYAIQNGTYKQTPPNNP